MHRVIAVALAVMLPTAALAQEAQQVQLQPAFEQSVPQPALNIDVVPASPIYKRWWFWTGIGATLAIGLTIALAVVFSRPPAGLHQSDFPCSTSCDHWINQPTQ